MSQAATAGGIRWRAAFWIAWLTATGVVLVNEAARWLSSAEGALAAFWSDRLADWTPFLPVLLLALPLWLIRRPLITAGQGWGAAVGSQLAESCPTPGRPGRAAEHLRAALFSAAVAATGLLMSVWVAHKFGDLPPAYHDEYSYLFQAKTFLAGRVAFPRHPQMPELFDQMHVLNEHCFASRYFPGAGLWIAPFLALGNPWWGHWTAHAFASFLVFWIGRHLGNNGVGLLAGLLTAVSPGMGLFSNLLLAHHPALVGLLVFVITFLKLTTALRHGQSLWIWAGMAGTALTYAMLCRPLTAAGIGLPFGVWFGWWVVTGRCGVDRQRPLLNQRLRTAAAMGAPILCGLAGLLAFNQAITGDPWVSPYQQYTQIYTPRHVYGFNNRVRGEARLGPRVLENYDVWAENLTPALAARNVWRRFVSSFRWTLGIVPLLMTAVVFALTVDHWSGDWRLIAAAILSLHAVHVPYWFEGMMGWHYVFESAPLWLLLFAGVSHRLLQSWVNDGRFGMPVWGALLVGVAVMVNLVTVLPLWPSRIDLGVSEVGFSRQRYAAFEDGVEQMTGGRRALVLIEADPSDRHIDYVTNDPSLDTRILRGRFRPGETDLGEVVRMFPDRDVWLIRVAAGDAADAALIARAASSP